MRERVSRDARYLLWVAAETTLLVLRRPWIPGAWRDQYVFALEVAEAAERAARRFGVDTESLLTMCEDLKRSYQEALGEER